MTLVMCNIVIGKNANSQLLHITSSSDLRPTDILCGRGNYSNPGNATFVQVCEAHRDQYTACKSFREKQVVADQIYDELCRAGSGRFLQLVKGPNRKKDRTKGGGGGGGDAAEEDRAVSYWKEMDRKDIGVKIKQGLRQKRNPPKRGRQQQQQPQHQQEQQPQHQQQAGNGENVGLKTNTYDNDSAGTGASQDRHYHHHQQQEQQEQQEQQQQGQHDKHTRSNTPMSMDPDDSSAEAAAAAALLDMHDERLVGKQIYLQ